VSFVPSLSWAQAGGSAPFTVRLAPDQDIRVYSIVAKWNGAAASGAFIACCSIYSQNDVLVARTRPEQNFAVGDTGVVTYAPFLHSEAAPPAGATVVPYVRTAGGQNRVTFVSEDPGQDPADISAPTANVVLSPVSSPDGTMVAWEQAGNLRVVNTDGTGETLIFDAAALGKSINGLDWAKDGSVILFGLSDGGALPAGYDLRTVEPDGANPTILYSDAANRVGLPLYSFDGSKIGFWAYSAGVNRLLRTMNADATNVQTAATVAGVGVLGDVQDYAWAKASQRLGYRSGGTTVHIVDFDGANDTNIGSGGNSLLRECWAPDDSAIYYSEGGFFVNLRKLATDGSGSTLVYADAAHVHGQMVLVRSARVYRNGTQAGPQQFVESVTLAGADFRNEQGPSFADAFSMF